MRKFLQKVFSVLLLLSIGVSALLYVFFDVAQLQLKNEAGRQVKSGKNLETIKVSLAEFEQAKGNDEFWVNGKLYDICSYVIAGDTVVVSVLHDTDEQNLVQTITESFEPNDSYAADNILHLTKHRIHPPGDFKILPAGILVPEPLVARHPEHRGYYLCAIASFHVSVLKPPPELAFA